MPINDPINNRKVAPGSLAFERRRQGASAMFSEGDFGDTPNYQTTINLLYQPRFTIVQTNQGAAKEAQRILRNVTDAEQRAKHHVTDWHNTLEWDTASLTFDWNATVLSNGAQNKVRLNHEVIRAIGVDSTGVWRFTPPTGHQGVYHVDVALFARFGHTARITEARLAVMRNGNVWRFVDMCNTDDVDTHHLEQVYMQGSCLVALESGDYLEYAFYLRHDGSGSGSGTMTDSEYYSYISAHRVNCAPDNDFYQTDTPNSGSTFINTP